MSYEPFPGFRGEIFVAATPNVNSGRADIIAGAGQGGFPVVNIRNSRTGAISSSQVYASNFRGGVRVASGDFNGDGVPEVATAPGVGGGPHLRILSNSTPIDIFPFDPRFQGGMYVGF